VNWSISMGRGNLLVLSDVQITFEGRVVFDDILEADNLLYGDPRFYVVYELNAYTSEDSKMFKR